LQEFVVTNRQYEWFDPNHRRAERVSDQDGQPVVNMTFWDACCFAYWLGQRLPTEAEWEYACRAGASEYAPFSFGSALNGTQANCNGNYPYGTEETGPYLGRTVTIEEGTFQPNNWKLWHMHGNVWEWCDSRFEPGGSARVLRGGSWSLDAGSCRSASRRGLEPGGRIHRRGFRLAAVPC
jgi:formylglycine-generating enzyme required for sulfatase activity